MGQARAAGAGGALGTAVAERLARSLFSGDHKPGEFLPKETELCALFHVSRPSVRSGVQMLVARGIVSRFAGQGTRVHDYRDWNILDPLVTRWMVEYAAPNPEFVRDILDFRHATEPYVAALAAGMATARDLLAMEEAFHAMEACLGAEERRARGPSLGDHEVDFHAAVYRATRNVVWAQLAHILRPAILLAADAKGKDAGGARDRLERHRALMECIRLRRPGDAFQAALGLLGGGAADARPAPHPAPMPPPPEPVGGGQTDNDRRKP